MTEFITFIEETRKEHTLAFMAQGMHSALSQNEIDLLIEHLQAYA